jgi:hypothetical protein
MYVKEEETCTVLICTLSHLVPLVHGRRLRWRTGPGAVGAEALHAVVGAVTT